MMMIMIDNTGDDVFTGNMTTAALDTNATS